MNARSITLALRIALLPADARRLVDAWIDSQLAGNTDVNENLTKLLDGQRPA